MIFTSRLILALYTDGRKGVLEEEGRTEQHSITQAASHELNIGEVG